MDFEQNVKKCNKLNGCIERYFGEIMTKGVKLRNQPNSTEVKRGASQMRFLRPQLGPPLRHAIRNAYVRKQLRTEEIKEYQRKWFSHVERTPPESLQRQTYLYHRTGRREIGRLRRRWAQQLI
jgi:hypothetical protein